MSTHKGKTPDMKKIPNATGESNVKPLPTFSGKINLPSSSFKSPRQEQKRNDASGAAKDRSQLLQEVVTLMTKLAKEPGESLLRFAGLYINVCEVRGIDPLVYLAKAIAEYSRLDAQREQESALDPAREMRAVEHSLDSKKCKYECSEGCGHVAFFHPPELEPKCPGCENGQMVIDLGGIPA